MGSQRQIVIIEDEASILDVIAYNVGQAGFDPVRAMNGDDGLRLVRSVVPALVILDVMLPGRGGHSVCRAIRDDEVTRAIPVLMLTALGEESDVVHGLDLGADDYMSKPFSPRELVARVSALVRRHDRQYERIDDGSLIRVGRLVVDSTRHEVRYGDREISLTRTELRILEAMVSRPGRVYTREELVQRAMGDDVWVAARTIDVHIRAIRRKLGDSVNVVETIRGVGYRVRDPNRRT